MAKDVLEICSIPNKASCEVEARFICRVVRSILRGWHLSQDLEKIKASIVVYRPVCLLYA